MIPEIERLFIGLLLTFCEFPILSSAHFLLCLTSSTFNDGDSDAYVLNFHVVTPVTMFFYGYGYAETQIMKTFSNALPAR